VTGKLPSKKEHNNDYELQYHQKLVTSADVWDKKREVKPDPKLRRILEKTVVSL